MILSASEQTIKDNPERIRIIVEMHKKATDYAMANREQMIEVAMQKLGQERKSSVRSVRPKPERCRGPQIRPALLGPCMLPIILLKVRAPPPYYSALWPRTGLIAGSAPRHTLTKSPFDQINSGSHPQICPLLQANECGPSLPPAPRREARTATVTPAGPDGFPWRLKPATHEGRPPRAPW
jgi:hypothetical protein